MVPLEPGSVRLRLNRVGNSVAVAAWLAEHDGVITAAQARALTLTTDQIRGRVERREWIPMARGLYRSASHEFGEAALVRGAVLAHRGVADRATALWWHGLVDELDDPLTLSSLHPTPGTRWSKCKVVWFAGSSCRRTSKSIAGSV